MIGQIIQYTFIGIIVVVALMQIFMYCKLALDSFDSITGEELTNLMLALMILLLLDFIAFVVVRGFFWMMGLGLS